MSGAPRVSVVLPYLRAEATIERALRSVLEQTLGDLELITVGDGSTDRTRAIIEGFAARDPRITMLSFDTNRGPSYARNRGIERARGDWIAVLDADDWFAADRLRALLEAARDAVVVVDNLVAIDPLDSSEVGPLFRDLPPALPLERIVAQRVPGSTYNFGYLKPIVRRSFIEQHGLRYREDLRTAEDLLFLAECCILSGPIHAVHEGRYFYNLQFSPRTRQRSATSHSLPVDRAVAAALNDLLARRASSLSAIQRRAIEERRDGLLRDADVSLFRHAVQTGRYLKAATLLAASGRVRGYLSGKAVERWRSLTKGRVPS